VQFVVSLAGLIPGAVYSDCAPNLLLYLGAESAVSSEHPLKSLSIRAGFDSNLPKPPVAESVSPPIARIGCCESPICAQCLLLVWGSLVAKRPLDAPPQQPWPN
jgi:hypothetical protein